MKYCYNCSEEKEAAQFRDGHARCRVCDNQIEQERRKQDPQYHEKRRQEQADYRAKDPERTKEIWAAWYAKNKEKRSEYNKEYQKRPEVQELLKEKARTRHLRDPHVSARRLIQRRVATGAMPRATDCFCMDCGGPAAEYDHYLGYTGKAREAVQAVCKSCHQNRTNSRLETVDAMVR